MKSSPARDKFLQELRSEQFDLLIIGGGITGAGIALDAASRGLKVALVEKKDFAWGTSSRSTKLIHGGLRYLKQLEFGLVREVGSERAVLHRLAPHLVVPEKMLLPLYEKRGFGSLLTSFGLKLYDWLAGVKPADQRKMLTRKNTLSAEPLLKPDDVKGGAIYAEYRTDDARLTTEIIKTSAQHGAVVINYCEVTEFLYANQQIIGARAKDQLNLQEFDIRASVVVNAAGPWVDELREINHSKEGKRLHLTKGVHIVVARDRLPVKQAIYFDADDERMIFAIPRGRTTYVGTTDTNYDGSKDNVLASREDAVYLVRAVNRTFPDTRLAMEDIESSWAGLRPLIHEEGKSASQLSRKDEIFESPTGLISIAGGKLTGYRKMAERIVDLVIERSFQDRDLKDCYTEDIALLGSGFRDYEDVKVYRQRILEQIRKLGLADVYAYYLVSNFGKQTDWILSDVRQGDPEVELFRAGVRFAVQHELAINVLDFFVRRTGMLYFYKDRIGPVKDAVLDEFVKLFEWTLEHRKKEEDNLIKAIAEVTQFTER